MPLPLWTLAPALLTATLPVLRPWRMRPERRAYWARFGAVAALLVALVVGQTLLGEGLAAWPWGVVFVAVACAYVYTLARLDDLDDQAEAFRWFTLACLLTSAAALITLNAALGFIVSVCTMLFLGACMPLRWHLRV
ncbi:sensor histidine kinase, partial [Deinococcus metallilatus]